jgi:hypothetical protein
MDDRFARRAKGVLSLVRHQLMFPAHAGMNRWLDEIGIEEVHVPRTRGDEPQLRKQSDEKTECSPHMRG